MQTDSPQFWTDDMVARFRDYCFPSYDRPSCQFDIFEKMFHLSIEDGEDDAECPKRSMDITYSCHTFDNPGYFRVSLFIFSYQQRRIITSKAT